MIDRQKPPARTPFLPPRRWPPRRGGQRRGGETVGKWEEGRGGRVLAFNHRPTGVKPDGGVRGRSHPIPQRLIHQGANAIVRAAIVNRKASRRQIGLVRVARSETGHNPPWMCYFVHVWHRHICNERPAVASANLAVDD